MYLAGALLSSWSLTQEVAGPSPFNYKFFSNSVNLVKTFREHPNIDKVSSLWNFYCSWINIGLMYCSWIGKCCAFILFFQNTISRWIAVSYVCVNKDQILIENRLIDHHKYRFLHLNAIEWKCNGWTIILNTPSIQSVSGISYNCPLNYCFETVFISIFLLTILN